MAARAQVFTLAELGLKLDCPAPQIVIEFKHGEIQL
jgi:hypothetical protein